MGIANSGWGHLVTSAKNASRLEVLFAQISHESEAGNFHEAFKLADWARRIAPGDTTTLSIYTQLLVSLGLFSKAEECTRGCKRPELAVLRGFALNALGRFTEAAELCQSLLARFAVSALPDLDSLASECADSFPGHSLAGWVGFDHDLRLTGAARPGSRISVRLGGVTLYPATTNPGISDAGLDSSSLNRFTCDVPAGLAGTCFVFEDSAELFGSPLVWPPALGTSGWVAYLAGALTGKVKMDWSPQSRQTVVIRETNGKCLREIVVEPATSSEAASFHIVLNSSELEFAELDVSILLPDRTYIPLVGSPVKPRPRIPHTDLQRLRPANFHQGFGLIPDRIVDIVIPVYAGLEETRTCLESVLATTTRNEVDIVVIDDASQDADLVNVLIKLAAENRITLLRNEVNAGFPASANKGMLLHPTRDVVLLNSDAELFGGWLTRLRTAAETDASIGTVTPLGEAASIVTYEDDSSCAFTHTEAAEIDRIGSEVNIDKSIHLPVGVGFCLFIKRACLNDTGYFDEVTFAQGYGEENDFCLRAASLGWQHVAASNVFVRHLGARSFGPRKSLLTERNCLILNELYPQYESTVSQFIATDPLLASRRAIDMKRLVRWSERPVLIMTCDLAGGVKRHVDLRSSELASAGHTVLVLQPADNARVRLMAAGSHFQNLFFRLPMEMPLLQSLLLELRLHKTEVHHLAGTPASFLDLLTGVCNRYEVYVHDYSWICPRLSLVNGSGQYCGEPSLGECETCIQLNGTPFEEPLSVASLRERSNRLLRGSISVIAPSEDVRHRLARYFPGLSIAVKPWENFPVRRVRPAGAVTPRLRVAVIGAISVPKGHRVLLECAQDAALRDLALEFVLIGFSCDDEALLATGRVSITGPYSDEEVSELIAREQCKAALFPSVIPETWCYALTHAIAEGLPIVSFELGAIAERLQKYANSSLLPLLSPAIRINEALIRFAAKQHSSNIREVPQVHPDSSLEMFMPTDSIETSVQFLPLPSGVYTFTVKSGISSAVPEGLALPAVQVSVAPGKSKGAVEFVARGETTDRWLARNRDMLIARIEEPGASLMLTSMRSPDSTPLGINIRRLDNDLFSAASDPDPLEPAPLADPGIFPAQIVAHIHRIGDVPFTDGWAGCLGDRLWIEAFAIGAIGQLPPDSVEYCGVTADGYQTPWLGNQMLCGSRGRATPMIGYAVRLKPEIADRYDCTYSGQFVSGKVSGPFKNGDLCCSDLPRDPLWGLELTATRR